jgi:hypothetical protein
LVALQSVLMPHKLMGMSWLVLQSLVSMLAYWVVMNFRANHLKCRDIIFERGSRASIEEGLIGFRTNFIEIPVYLSYKDWLKDEYYKVSGGAGLIYSNLIRAEDIRFGETA